MLTSDLAKNRECNADVMDVLKNVASVSSDSNAIEKYYMMRSFIAINPPLDVLAGLSISVHASREALKVLSSPHVF